MLYFPKTIGIFGMNNVVVFSSYAFMVVTPSDVVSFRRLPFLSYVRLHHAMPPPLFDSR